LREGWIPQIPSVDVASTDLYGSCYHILAKTSDDESIVHEFPDPNSLDTHNWQGFPIDDDVVVSHGQNLEKYEDGDYNPAAVDSTGTNQKEASFFNSEMYWLLVVVFVTASAFYVKMKRPTRKRGYTNILSEGKTGTFEMSI